MSNTRFLFAVPALWMALTACREDSSDQNVDFSTSAITEGSPEAIGVLSFLNDANTTLEVLDDDVPLPSHAAGNVIDHRNGPDGAHGTSDDDAFDSVAEVLGVPQLGPSRLQALVDYAASQGFVPSGDDLLGTYDGVPFSVDEAAATLALVNSATETQLDDEVELDSRAVGSILAARPIASMDQLAELYYVGASALTKLKAYAISGSLADVGEDCAEHNDCVDGARCEGRPSDGSPAIGKCVAIGNVPGSDESCTSDTECLDGLACAGLTVYGGTGYCRPLWMFGTFTSSTSPVAIPDNDPAGASMSVVVYGLATVPEDIVVTLDIDHPRPQDLVVTLISTNGSDSTLWSNDESPAFYLPALGIERDNYVNGQLTLQVTDSVTGEAGVLNGFEVWLSSRYD